MNIWVCRHGQTKLNKLRLIQGRIDEPLNETGISQAKQVRKEIGDVHFDAVYASPLDRAISTAAIVGGVEKEAVIIEPRIIETDFGCYETRPYTKLGLKMTLYWSFPEVFPAPETVETVKSMVERSHSFLKELEEKKLENVLVVCHGGIIRAIRGYFEGARLGIKWRPKPKNCQVRVYESKGGIRKLLRIIDAAD